MLTKKQFFIRYYLFYNLYGNVLLTGGLLFGAAACLMGQRILMEYPFGDLHTIILPGLLFLFSGTGMVASLVTGVSITVKGNDKYKFYRITMMRIARNGFHEEYFEDFFDSPCYRLLAMQILKETGRLKDYGRLKRRMTMRYTD